MKVGDKVVCINDRDSYHPVNNRIKEGDIYTVKDVDYDGDIKLVETVPTNTEWWLSSRFRKLITDHTFTNELTEELANKPLIKERIERVREKELI